MKYILMSGYCLLCISFIHLVEFWPARACLLTVLLIFNLQISIKIIKGVLELQKALKRQHRLEQERIMKMIDKEAEQIMREKFAEMFKAKPQIEISSLEDKPPAPVPGGIDEKD